MSPTGIYTSHGSGRNIVHQLKAATNMDKRFEYFLLQEQREALKQQGQKHEDTIMKDNARLQKEVKHRILYMKEFIEKIDKGIV